MAVTSSWACMKNPDHSDVPIPGKQDPVPVESIGIDETVALNTAEIEKLVTAVVPSNATDKTVSWSSSDRSVASVDSEGNITGLKAGTATITVTARDGKKTDTCLVTVTDPDAGKEYTLVWEDNFDYEGLPAGDSWTMEIWNPGQVNHELQYYTSSSNNVDARDGILTITLRKEDDGRITSARVVTAGKRSFTYGRFEIRAKLPRGKGTWPAIWMLGENINGGVGWPTCGEIDIMEHVGYDQGRIHASTHTQLRNHSIGTQATATTSVPDCSDEFHVYSIEWTRLGITASIDGVKYFTYMPNSYAVGDWPFNKPEFLLLNIAWGGDWGAAGGGVDESVLPQTMEIDYVRVYQKQ